MVEVTGRSQVLVGGEASQHLDVSKATAHTASMVAVTRRVAAVPDRFSSVTGSDFSDLIEVHYVLIGVRGIDACACKDCEQNGQYPP